MWEERESWEERELCGRGPKAGARVKSVWVEMSGGCRPVCGTQSRPKEGGKRVGSGITRVGEVSEQSRGKGAQAAARDEAGLGVALAEAGTRDGLGGAGSGGRSGLRTVGLWRPSSQPSPGVCPVPPTPREVNQAHDGSREGSRERGSPYLT